MDQLYSNAMKEVYGKHLQVLTHIRHAENIGIISYNQNLAKSNSVIGDRLDHFNQQWGEFVSKTYLFI